MKSVKTVALIDGEVNDEDQGIKYELFDSVTVDDGNIGVALINLW